MNPTEEKNVWRFLLFAWLLCSGHAVNWQGTGNFTADNLTFIENYLTNNFNKSKIFNLLKTSQLNYMTTFALTFSNQLNQQWDPAWNVFIAYISDQTNSDSVVYGYAFRGHWVWYNGIKMVDERYVTFIIWKDYNCISWVTFNYFSSPSSNIITTPYILMINNMKENLNLSNVWSIAQAYSQYLVETSTLIDPAFTVIVSQSKNTLYYGRFCSNGYYTVSGLDAGNNGKTFVIKMR